MVRIQAACDCTVPLTHKSVLAQDVYAGVREGHIVVLTLRNTTLSSAALTELSTLNQLYHLDLSGSKVDSLESLPELPALVDLDVSNTAIASLSGLEHAPVVWLDISNTQIKTLDGVPSTVKTLIAPHLSPISQDSVSDKPAPDKPAPQTKTQSTPFTGNPHPALRPDLKLPDGWRSAQRGSGTSKHNGFTNESSGTISTGSGFLRVEMKDHRQSAGAVQLTLRSGSAIVWLMDPQGEWLAYALLPGDLRVYGHFGAWGLDHYFFIQSDEGFEGLTWAVK